MLSLLLLGSSAASIGLLGPFAGMFSVGGLGVFTGVTATLINITYLALAKWPAAMQTWVFGRGWRAGRVRLAAGAHCWSAAIASRTKRVPRT
jgi:hypothetical protein